MAKINQITDVEAAALSSFLDVGDIKEVAEFAQETSRIIFNNKADFSFLGTQILWTMAAIFNAGKVQGIRQERAKRKK